MQHAPINRGTRKTQQDRGLGDPIEATIARIMKSVREQNEQMVGDTGDPNGAPEHRSRLGSDNEARRVRRIVDRFRRTPMHVDGDIMRSRNTERVKRIECSIVDRADRWT